MAAAMLTAFLSLGPRRSIVPAHDSHAAILPLMSLRFFHTKKLYNTTLSLDAQHQKPFCLARYLHPYYIICGEFGTFFIPKDT